jgi:hypothetical protein
MCGLESVADLPTLPIFGSFTLSPDLIKYCPDFSKKEKRKVNLQNIIV